LYQHRWIWSWYAAADRFTWYGFVAVKQRIIIGTTAGFVASGASAARKGKAKKSGSSPRTLWKE
jgi:hypothetical protein